MIHLEKPPHVKRNAFLPYLRDLMTIYWFYAIHRGIEFAVSERHELYLKLFILSISWITEQTLTDSSADLVQVPLRVIRAKSQLPFNVRCLTSLRLCGMCVRVCISVCEPPNKADWTHSPIAVDTVLLELLVEKLQEGTSKHADIHVRPMYFINFIDKW